MTKEQENKAQKLFVGVSVSIIVMLLGIMTTLMFKFSDHLMSFEFENNKAHQLLFEQNTVLYDWTHSVHDFIIIPNENRSKKNAIEINKLNKKVENL